MASRTYTNADADRQYGKGRTEFGSWIRKPSAKLMDPYEGLSTGRKSIDDIMADASETIRSTGGFSARLGVGAQDEQMNRLESDHAISNARAKSNPLLSMLTSVFSPEQRESTARWIEGDARDREGLGARARSFAAGAIGGAGEDSEWGGAMGEVTPLNVATGFGVTRTTPITSAIRAARAGQRAATHATPRSWNRGTEELGDLAMPAAEAPVAAATPPTGGGGGGFMSWFRGTPTTPKGVPGGNLTRRQTPTVEETIQQALEELRQTPSAARSSLPPDLPVRGGFSGRGDLTRESLARRTAQGSGSQPPIPRSVPVATEEMVPGAPVQSSPGISDPRRLLPAFGETSETITGGLTRGDNSAIPGRKTFLRPESRVIDLANELAQSEIGPGARVTGLKAYPRPSGSDELSRALRQRAHVDDSMRKARQKFNPESGFADPQLLSFLARTGGGAAAGAASPETLGADSDGDYLEGGIKGAVLGAVAPDVVRGVGRVARAIPRGLPQLGKQVFDEVQSLRYMGALSGRAIPKSIMGNLAAPFMAAAEKGTTAPIRSFFSPRTVGKYFDELRNPTVRDHTMEQVGSPNLFGRILGAGDVATTEALERGGLTADESARHLLRTPTGKLGITGKAQEMLQSRGGRAALMFQTTPANQVVHGGRAAMGLDGRRAQTLAAISAALGLGHGSMESSDPLEIAMTAPLAGVYSAPYLMGAGAGKLARGATSVATGVLRGVSPVPELGRDIIDPTRFLRPITDPAIGAWFRDSSSSRSTRRRTRRSSRRRTRD